MNENLRETGLDELGQRAEGPQAGGDFTDDVAQTMSRFDQTVETVAWNETSTLYRLDGGSLGRQ